jgi:hypothetical protein
MRFSQIRTFSVSGETAAAWNEEFGGSKQACKFRIELEAKPQGTKYVPSLIGVIDEAGSTTSGVVGEQLGSTEEWAHVLGDMTKHADSDPRVAIENLFRQVYLHLW